MWGMLGLAVAGALSGAMLVAVALAMAYPQLPDVSEMRDYRPKLSMRIFSADGKHLGTIRGPEHPHNMAWGGTDRRTLHLAAQTGIYRLRLNCRGAVAFVQP